MKVTMIMASTLAMSLMGTGCIATHKYVAKTVAPVETRVSGTEAKNTDQDKQLSTHSTQIEELDKDLSRTKERLTDADAKAVAAGNAAKVADNKADQANQAAGNAAQAADNARTFAANGITQLGTTLSHTVDAVNNYQLSKSESVLFNVNRATLTDDAKAKLDEMSQAVSGLDRYVVEVQGYTDKTGAATYNEELSARRADAVARYLANEHKIPVRSINVLGSGYANPVADDKTRDGRKQNRRVEVRLYVPEVASASSTLAKSGGQQ